MSSTKTTKVHSTHSGSATSMADLMKSVKTNFVSPHKGDNLEGIITKLTSSEILVDIGAKTEAVVLEKDRQILKSLLSSLKVGDSVSVYVLNPESDFGNPVVSLRRYNDNKVWGKLEQLQKAKEPIEVTINELTKGGFLVSSKEGLSGFLPNSQTVFIEDSQNLIGKTIKVAVIEINRTLKKIIFSQKAVSGSKDFDSAMKILKTGQKITATISNIAPFGIFTLIDLGDDKIVEGFVHISEVSWEKISEVPQSFNAGDKIEAEIVNFDRETKRINLSIKRLTEDPFSERLSSFKPDQKVTGVVSKVLSSGVLLNLEEGIEGFIKKDKIPPTQSYKEGLSVISTVVEVDTKKHRVILVPVLTEKPIGYR